MATIKYLKSDTAYLYKTAEESNVLIDLLWGDRIKVLDENAVNGKVKVIARGTEGFVNESDLGNKRLLELYFIDVGQGDGILIVTPDDKHILIDGGYNREATPHGKSAADFVDWKFNKDYMLDKIMLDAMIASHCDADHYGGLWDLVNPTPKNKSELNCQQIEIKNFYHAGVSWWKNNQGKKDTGKSEDGYLTDLLEDNVSVKVGLKAGAQPELAGNWADFLQCLINLNVDISRLSCDPAKGMGYLPGFDSQGKVQIKVLAPVESEYRNKKALKDFGSDSKNTNGNSIMLRVDYGRTRILLAGDLNKVSQQYLLEVFKGNRLELAADVAKSCHHGSDDCSYEFLETIHPSASVISSGDDEKHSHPRPNIVAACGITGYKIIADDELITPLVFCTEISRSVKIGNPYQVDYKDYPYLDHNLDIKLVDETKTNVLYTRQTSGGLKASKKDKIMNQIWIIDGLVYGLVNVRTDGNTILCATLNEGKSKWEIKKFDSRF
jgi:beta-lactamase superfamily II metal-dependent hydrolase